MSFIKERMVSMMKTLAPFARVALCALPLAAFVSCSGRIVVDLREGADATLSGTANVEMSVDKTFVDDMKKKAQGLGVEGADAQASLPPVDVKTVKANLSTRPEFIMGEFVQKSPTTVSGVISFKDISAIGKRAADAVVVTSSPSPAPIPPFSYSRSASASKLAFSLGKGNAAVLSETMGGFQAGMIELLAPPVVMGDDMGKDEYRKNILPFLGKKDMAILDAAGVDIVLKMPGTITASSGGEASGREFRTRLSLMDILVLEKPLAFSLTWKKE